MYRGTLANGVEVAVKEQVPRALNLISSAPVAANSHESWMVSDAACAGMVATWMGPSNASRAGLVVTCSLLPPNVQAITIRGNADAGFHRELDILKRLDHPNLLRLLGFCVNGGYAYIVTPYAHNGNLAGRIDGNSAPLSQQQRLAVLLGTTQGLRYLHGLRPHAVLHRCTSPTHAFCTVTGSIMEQNARVSLYICCCLWNMPFSTSKMPMLYYCRSTSRC